MNEPRGRPFGKGNTLGRGRPKGSHNKAASPGLQLLDDFAVPLMRKCISLALHGDPGPMRMCMDRMFPVRRDAPIRMKMPKITSLLDIAGAAEVVTQDIAHGRITPTEGEKVMNVLEIRSGIIVNGPFESRVAELEADRVDKSLPRAA